MDSQENSTTERLIESDTFPFEFLSRLGQKESWRKEIYRPVYHIHKWWAKRLGSIFRGLLLGGALDTNVNFTDVFYAQHNLDHVIVFDPFMGSGTTVGEAQKLRMTALGRDINPVACEAVRISLSPLDRRQLLLAFEEVSCLVEKKIRDLYKTTDRYGRNAEVLYYFWVMQALCPGCNRSVDLFKSFIFARNAYPKKKPEVQVICPCCNKIFQSLYHQSQVTCPHCTHDFNSRQGNTQGSKATCQCGEQFSIVKSISRIEEPPKHRLYAKLVLYENDQKEYLSISQADLEAFDRCEKLLQKEIEDEAIQLPSTTLTDGENTKQAINYNYNSWRDFFNSRQLLGLAWLHRAILEVPSCAERDALLALFSGVLEFNNLFASYKGEGTGAVRHMFSHHILKPERTPIEANIWGTHKSSGSFSGLFRSKLLRALEYRQSPFEIGLNGTKKIFNASPSMAEQSLVPWGVLERGRTSLSCGDSSKTDLSTGTVDLIVTDPPFFDNVNYSELADFFYAWQTLYPRGFIDAGNTTRHKDEVQDADPQHFSNKLASVFNECNRLLKDDGLLIFSYHHSKADGWGALSQAILDAGLYVKQSFPVYAELLNSTPKSQAKSPILIDAILVCKKGGSRNYGTSEVQEAIESAIRKAAHQISRLVQAGFEPTEGDKFVIGMSQLLVCLGNSLEGNDAKLTISESRVLMKERLCNLKTEPLAHVLNSSIDMNNIQLKLF